MNFERSVELPASIDACFEFHERPGALRRLIPPWEAVNIVRSDESIEPGSEVQLTTKMLGMRLEWLARHESLSRPHSFVDTQVRGPFASWRHEHLFEVLVPNRTKMTDRITYEIPFGLLGAVLGRSFVARKLDAMFEYRHRITRQDLVFANALAALGENGNTSKRIAVTGSSGLIGGQIVSLLTTLGHRVIRLVRSSKNQQDSMSTRSAPMNTAKGQLTSVAWSPQHGLDDPKPLEAVDAVIHLAGKGIGDRRWTKRVKSELVSSRVQATSVLARQLAQLTHPPKAFVCASGVGIYGNQGERVIDETQPAATDFLGCLASDWEAASKPLVDCGTRVCFGRLGVVLSPQGGALAKMLPLFQLGIGGRLGSGKQYWSWIGHQDASSAFVWLALNPHCSGPYNLVAGAVTNRDFTECLATVLGRPALLPVPAIALRIALGEMADGMLLASTRASGNRLVATGFPMRQIDLEQSFQELLGVQDNSKSAILSKT